jgi:hypothetical protein
LYLNIVHSNVSEKERQEGEHMSSIHRIATIGIALAFITGMANAEIYVKQGSFKLSGMVEIETAEMMKVRTALGQVNRTLDHNWYSHITGTLNFQAQPADNFELKGSFEFKQYMNMSVWWATTMNRAAYYYLGDFLYHDFYIREAQGILSALESEALSLTVSLGLQPYKYNSESREFGEYLFRSGTYPFLLMGEFDRPFSRLTGLRAAIASNLDFINLKADAFVLTERELRPYWDLSLAGTGAINLFSIFEIGGGINLAHYIPMNEKYVTPDSSVNAYFKDSSLVWDETGQADVMTYDTGYYTFKGTKIMARGSIDLFGVFGLFGFSRGDGSLVSDIFGATGGKLFGEIAVIGLDDYPKSVQPDANPLGYDTLAQRMPWVAGFHLPFWKLLDECELECEWYPNPYPNNTAMVHWAGLPLPYPKNISDDYALDRGARWYWSVYLKKQVLKNFTIVSQIGRDHLRWEMPMPYYNSNYDFEEAMCKPDQWGWHVKTIFSF